MESMGKLEQWFLRKNSLDQDYHGQPKEKKMNFVNHFFFFSHNNYF